MHNIIIFSIQVSEMGLNPLLIVSIIFSGLFFLVAFVISSRNMDSDGIMNWMMTKPKDWMGYKNKN